LPVLVLSMHEESLYAERALRAGARGYVMKQEAPDKVMRALRRVLAGEVYVSENAARRLLHAVAGSSANLAASPLERLSDRELEVFQMIGKGLGTRAYQNEVETAERDGTGPARNPLGGETIGDRRGSP
jgi:DNA-binding NarL/FixJ family response regulator